MSDFTDTYLDKLAFQFSDSVNLQALIEAFLTEFEELNTAMIAVRDERYIDTAEGVQLDGIGEIVGISRPYNYDDDDYRFLIRVQVMINNTNSTAEDTLNIMTFVFGTNVVRYICTTNLFAIYEIGATLTPIQEEILLKIPKTLGIEDLEFKSAPDLETAFAFDEDPIGLGFGTISDPDIGGNFISLI